MELSSFDETKEEIILGKLLVLGLYLGFNFDDWLYLKAGKTKYFALLFDYFLIYYNYYLIKHIRNNPIVQQ